MSSNSNTKNLFKDQSFSYALYRPTYDSRLYDNILNYGKKNGNLNLNNALDVATGNGQAALDLSAYFDNVIAMDIQVNQINHAFTGYNNIKFIEGSAENICLDANSVDTICVAQALHWFDTSTFYKEAHRVLRSNGTLAIWGYDLCFITSDKHDKESASKAQNASNVILDLYKNSELSKYWDNRRFLIDNHYLTIAPNKDEKMEKLWRNVEQINMNMSKKWKLSDLVRYISTWSAYNTYMKTRKINLGSDLDPCVIVKRQLREIYGTNDTEVTITWPIFLHLATK
jgi:ubiquinone/menaquinone biosynthesis C-methylase UbiE